MQKISKYIQELIQYYIDHYTNSPVFEMSNQYEKDTGIPGCIYISSEEGQHGGRIKYYLNKPSRKYPCIIYNIYTLKLVKDKLKDEVDAKTRKQILKWIELNQSELIRFWETGYDWNNEEKRNFEDNLKKV